MNDKEYNNIIDIVRDTQNGVDSSFDALYSVSYPYAYGAAASLLKNKEDIEDALQMAFHYVSRYIKDLKTPEAYLKWLNRIVINECKKILIEQNKHHKIFFAEKKRLMMIEEAEVADADQIEKTDLIDTINRIIDGMKPEKSEILKLYYFERLSYAEISQKLGIPIGTVMSRLHNAKKELEKKIKELQKDGTILWSFPILPLVAALLSYNIKAKVPAAILSKAAGTAAVSSAGAASTSTATATAAVSGTAVSGAASAATAVGTSVAVKAVVVAVAATVAVGGGITANRVIEKQTAAAETAITEKSEYASRIMLSENDIELTKPISESETEKETQILERSSESVLSKAETMTEVQAADTTAKSGEKQESVIISEKQTSATTRENRTKRSENTTSTTSPSTATTQKQTERTTVSTTHPTSFSTTQKQSETTTKKPATTDPAAELSVSGGVLNGYSGSGGNVNIPSTVNGQAVTAIGAGAFEGSNITSVSIPSGVTKIGQTSFSDCKKLTSVSLPSTLTSIGDCAFDGCSSLSSVTIPNSVTNIGDSAFDGCNNLKIRCSEGSAAYEYAVENSVDYELI